MNNTTSRLGDQTRTRPDEDDLRALLEAARSANKALRPVPPPHSASALARYTAARTAALDSLHRLRPRLATAVWVACGRDRHVLAVDLAEALSEQLLTHFDYSPTEIYLMRRAIESARRDRNWLAEARLLVRVSRLLLGCGSDVTASQAAVEELARAAYCLEQARQKEEARVVEAIGLGVSATAQLHLGDLETAERFAAEAVELAEQLHEQRLQGLHTLLLARILLERGEQGAGRKHLFGALTLLAEAGDDLGVGQMFTELARSALLQGRPDHALPDAVTAVRRLEHLGYPRYLAVAKAVASVAHAELGQFAEAEREQAEALSLVQPGSQSARMVREALELPARLPSAAMLAGLHALDAFRHPTPTVPVAPQVARIPPAGAHSPVVGRDGELARLDEASEAITMTGPVVVTISGPAGTGKSALAHRWAHVHGRADRFADGCLYAVLHHGALSPEVTAGIALDQFLRALAVPVAEIDAAAALTAKAVLFRRVTAGTRLLIVLDDVLDPAVLGHLLPDSPTSMVIATSRSTIPLLCAGQVEICLDGLAIDAALSLLGSVVDRQRLDGQVPAARRITAACAGNPGALELVAAGLAVQPSIPLEVAAAALEEATTAGATPIEAAVRLAYSWLPQETARAYQRLVLLPVTTLTRSVAGAAAGLRGTEEAGLLLEQLAQRRLLSHGIDGRYRIPEAPSAVVHQLAASALGPAACEAVIRRATTQIAYEAAVAGQHAVGERENLRVHLPQRQWPSIEVQPSSRFDRVGADQWLETERVTIAQAAIAAVELRDLPLVWMSANALGRLCLQHGGMSEAMTVLTMAITCIQEATSSMPPSKAQQYALPLAELLVTLAVVTLCGLRSADEEGRAALTAQAEGHLDAARVLALPGNKLWKLGKSLTAALQAAGAHHADEQVAEALHRLAADYAGRIGKQRLQGHHTWILGTLLVAAGRRLDAVAAFTATEEILHAPQEKAAVLLSAAVLFAGQRRLDRADALLEHAATLLAEPGHADLLCTVHAARALVAGMNQNRFDAIASRDAALALLPSDTGAKHPVVAALKPVEEW